MFLLQIGRCSQHAVNTFIVSTKLPQCGSLGFLVSEIGLYQSEPDLLKTKISYRLLNKFFHTASETILLFYSALHEKSISRGMRAVDSINAVGTIIHHSSASLCVSALLCNGEFRQVILLIYLLILCLQRRLLTFPNMIVIYPNRDVIQTLLPLVMQVCNVS